MRDGVYVRWPPNVIHAFEDGMVSFGLVEHAAGALVAVIAVVVDPSIAENLLTETTGPDLALPVVIRIRAGRTLDGERMGGCSNAESVSPNSQIGHVLHLVVGQIAEPGEDDHHIGVAVPDQSFQEVHPPEHSN